MCRTCSCKHHPNEFLLRWCKLHSANIFFFFDFLRFWGCFPCGEPNVVSRRICLGESSSTPIRDPLFISYYQADFNQNRSHLKRFPTIFMVSVKKVGLSQKLREQKNKKLHFCCRHRLCGQARSTQIHPSVRANSSLGQCKMTHRSSQIRPSFSTNSPLGQCKIIPRSARNHPSVSAKSSRGQLKFI